MLAVLAAAVFAFAGGGCADKSYAQEATVAVRGDGAGGAWLVAYDSRAEVGRMGPGPKAERKRFVRIGDDGEASSTSTLTTDVMPHELIASKDAVVGRRWGINASVLFGSPRMLPIIDETGTEIGSAPDVDGRRFDIVFLEQRVVAIELSGDRWLAHQSTDFENVTGASVADDGTLRVVVVTANEPVRTPQPNKLIGTRSAPSRMEPNFITAFAIGRDGAEQWRQELRGFGGVAFSRDGHVVIGVADKLAVVRPDGEVRTSEGLGFAPRGVAAFANGSAAAWSFSSIARVDPSGAVHRTDVGFDVDGATPDGSDLLVGGATFEEIMAVRLDASLGEKWRLSGCDCDRVER
jgi:hypothetical protein